VADRPPESRWSITDGVTRGDDYDEKWRLLAAAGRSIHGEADFVCRFEPSIVLDAGCGTGRVAIELAARGIDVVGVDLDPGMLTAAIDKAPDLTWVEADIGAVSLDRRFDVITAPGNVMIFLQPGSERATVANLVDHLAPGGRLIAGFQLDAAYTLDRYDADCTAVGLVLDERFATWEGDPFDSASNYAVSVHRRAADGPSD